MLGFKRALLYAYVVAVVLCGWLLTFPYRIANAVRSAVFAALNHLRIKRTVLVDKLDAVNESWLDSVACREYATRDRAWQEYIKHVKWSEAQVDKARKQHHKLADTLTMLLDD